MRLALSKRERASLYDRAFQLAWFLHPDLEMAKLIAKQSIDALPQTFPMQGTNLLQGPGLAYRMKMTPELYLQRLVFVKSDDVEIIQEVSPAVRDLTTDDMIVRYLKQLVRQVAKRNSFWAMVSMARVLHDFRTQQTMEIYQTLAPERGNRKTDEQCREVKKKLIDNLQLRFKNHIRAELVHNHDSRREKRFVRVGDSPSWATLVKECLDRFLPWDTHCVDHSRCEDALNQNLVGLGIEERAEIGRFHILLHPDCFEKLILKWNLRPFGAELFIPQFFTPEDGRPFLDETPARRAERCNAPELSDEEIANEIEAQVLRRL